MKIEKGDIYLIETSTRKCFLQYCHYNEGNGYLVRVFVRPKDSFSSNNDAITEEKEDFCVFFYLKQALRDKSVIKIGNSPLPSSFEVPLYMRAESVFQNSKYKWRIVPLDPNKAQLPVEKLSQDQAKLSPYQIWFSQGLIEKIDSGFSLSTWQ